MKQVTKEMSELSDSERVSRMRLIAASKSSDKVAFIAMLLILNAGVGFAADHPAFGTFAQK
ncbi:hypothetical protein [Geobacter sp.]|uniref:hypothetical protein n=1 Tax=Geobacter sp. TaxID=46610 RepID=UPI0027B95E7C|nr:hypothetical protein [Geobacter sp.]